MRTRWTLGELFVDEGDIVELMGFVWRVYVSGEGLLCITRDVAFNNPKAETITLTPIKYKLMEPMRDADRPYPVFSGSYF